MNGWNPELPAQNKIDEPPRHAETYINVGNAAMSGVMFVALTASIYGGIKAGAIDAAIVAFRTSSEVTETATEASQAPKVVKPVAKDVGEEAGEQGQKIERVAGEAGRGAVGARTEEEINKDAILFNLPRLFTGQTKVEDFLNTFVAGKDKDQPLDIVFDPEKYSSLQKMKMELLGEEIERRNIPPEQLAEEMVRVGQSKKASQFLEEFYLNFRNKTALSSQRAEEFMKWWEEELGLKWPR